MIPRRERWRAHFPESGDGVVADLRSRSATGTRPISRVGMGPGPASIAKPPCRALDSPRTPRTGRSGPVSFCRRRRLPRGFDRCNCWRFRQSAHPAHSKNRSSAQSLPGRPQHDQSGAVGRHNIPTTADPFAPLVPPGIKDWGQNYTADHLT